MDAKYVYDQITGRKYILLFALAVAALFTFLADVFVGPAQLSIKEVLLAVFAKTSVEPTTQVVVWNIRLPIALMAVVIGSSLSMAGAQMQTILNNSLASPYTLGVSSAAGFGAALSLVIGVNMPASAFLFAMLSCLLMYFATRKIEFSSEVMILLGIAVLFFFNSLTAGLEYIASEQQLQALVFWLMGSLQRTTWLKLGISTIVLFIIALALAKDVWKLTAMRLGDEKAKSMGIDIERIRFKVFTCVSFLTATAVCFVGTIGFIGLVAPHVARMLVGDDQRFFIPASVLAGAVLLSGASVLSKLIVPGAILPIGIVTSLVGVPFFSYLVIRRRRRYG